jgi:beta-galactosidase/beta-glucuronidase
MFYTAQSGIWQTVWLEWVPNIYIESVKITPLVLQSAVEVDILINNSNIFNIHREDKDSSDKTSDSVIYGKMEGIDFQIDVYDKGILIKSETSEYPKVIIPMSNFKYWSPENPYLYDMVISAGEDRVESYFAMRIVSIQKDSDGIPRIYLNHRPYFQNGILDQGYWPDGLYTAPSDEAFIFDILKAKELGFNMIRKHIKIEPLRWYYHCDRLGVLVWQDMVNGGGKYNELIVGYLPTLFPSSAKLLKDKHYRLFGRKNKEGRKEWVKECEETVEHLYNCPSIVVWVPFNEAWGQFDAKKIYAGIKEIDKTRLIDHASGWYDQKCGDFKSIHNYFHKLKIKAGKQPIVLSEFGGFACYMKEHSYSWKIYGYRIYLNEEDLNRDFQKIFAEDIMELKKKGLCAAVYTQLSDVEDEVNGLFTYDRKICKVKPLTDRVRL